MTFPSSESSRGRACDTPLPRPGPGFLTLTASASDLPSSSAHALFTAIISLWLIETCWGFGFFFSPPAPGASQVALVVKSLPASARDTRDIGSIPGSGRSPGGGHGNPLQYSCLENPMDRGAWRATAHRVAKSQTRLKHARTHAVFFFLMFFSKNSTGDCLWIP